MSFQAYGVSPVRFPTHLMANKDSKNRDAYVSQSKKDFFDYNLNARVREFNTTRLEAKKVKTMEGYRGLTPTRPHSANSARTLSTQKPLAASQNKRNTKAPWRPNHWCSKTESWIVSIGLKHVNMSVLDFFLFLSSQVHFESELYL